MLAIDRQPEIYLHMGDMAYTNGTTPQFDTRFFAVYREILRHTVVWPAMGNHEGLSSDSGTETGPYYEAYVLPRAGEAGGLPSGTEAYYAFDYANVHFVVLDSHDSPRLPGGPMLRWLEADLAATDQEWIVAFWHHPPYTHGTHNSDVESQLIEMRRYAVPILEAAGVDLVLTGHSHSYERSMLVHGAYDTPTTAAGHVVDPGDGRLDGEGPYFTGPNGAVYVVAGHGGQSLGGRIDHPLMYFSELAFGSCLLDADGARLSLTNLRWDGAETDHVDLVKSDGIYLFAPIGGERVLAGREISIVWGTIGGSGRVRVEASLDDGRSWETLAGDLADGGHLRWATPRRLVDRARVRVTDTERRWLRATSRPFSLVADAVEQAIFLGGEWEYLDDGAPPPSDWRTATGGWARGPAQLGYGQGDEATRLYDASPNVPTVLFRRAIEIDAEVTAARLHVIYDDGFVAYVDGVEVARENVGDTALAAFATATTAGDATVDVAIDPTPLSIGSHVIAVEVKQVSATSSDLSFDLSLELDLRAALDPVIEADAGPP
ncbi:MAG: metallophosphoesterase, partial [Sandaracinaceae bacterium]|nr:metallophosphoesterase [Sandaracinaceae bacterium]